MNAHPPSPEDLRFELIQVRAASGPPSEPQPSVARFVARQGLLFLLVIEVVFVLAAALLYYLR